MSLMAGVGGLTLGWHRSFLKLSASLLTLSKSFSCDTEKNKRYCQKLLHRGLIRVSGRDNIKFLQGLITNDISLLEKFPAIYSMMLNVQGRVLHDLIIYRTQDESSVIVECDRGRLSELIASLSRYKLRNKVNIVDANEELDVWSVFGDSKPLDVSFSHKHVHSYARDPRHESLGGRLLLVRGITAMSVTDGFEQPSDDLYRRNLCVAGIGEGSGDFPPEHCFPLECNLAFLNGVSFDKGCYVGQELTARTHHTGVIRKRIMPIILSEPGDQRLVGAAVVNKTGKVCGKIRSVCGDRGIGLLRVADVIAGDGVLQIRLDGTLASEARTFIPEWWPSETDAVVRHSKTGGKELEDNDVQSDSKLL